MLVVTNCLVLEGSVDFRVPNQTYGDDFNDQIVNTEFQIRIKFVDRAAHVGGAFHIDLHSEKEMGYRPEGGDQSPRDRATHLADRLISISRWAINNACASGAGNWDPPNRSFRGRRFLLIADRGFDIALDDATTGAAALDRFEIDPGLARHRSEERRV